MSLTAEEIDRYVTKYRQGHAGYETLGQFIERMRESGR